MIACFKLKGFRIIWSKFMSGRYSLNRVKGYAKNTEHMNQDSVPVEIRSGHFHHKIINVTV